MSACTIRERKTQQESEQPTNDRVHIQNTANSSKSNRDVSVFEDSILCPGGIVPAVQMAVAWVWLQGLLLAQEAVAHLRHYVWDLAKTRKRGH